MSTRLASLSTAVLALSTVTSLVACSDDPPADEQELITSVILTFTPSGGGTALVFEVDDPDGDGGSAPTVDPIALPAGSYTLAIAFENRLEDPPEDITLEVADEADEHQVFLTGSAVFGPASTTANAALTHAYADTDADGNPIGLANTITAAAGSGNLIVTLRHLPPLDGTPVKTAELAAQVAASGLSSIGGESDASVTFPVSVP